MKAIQRELVWEKSGGVCALCNRELDPELWHLGHDVPRSRGGSTKVANLVALHPKCNLSMGTLTLKQARERL